MPILVALVNLRTSLDNQQREISTAMDAVLPQDSANEFTLSLLAQVHYSRMANEVHLFHTTAMACQLTCLYCYHHKT